MDFNLSATSSSVIDTIAVRLSTGLYFMLKYRYIIFVANSFAIYYVTYLTSLID